MGRLLVVHHGPYTPSLTSHASVGAAASANGRHGLGRQVAGGVGGLLRMTIFDVVTASARPRAFMVPFAFSKGTGHLRGSALQRARTNRTPGLATPLRLQVATVLSWPQTAR